MSKFCSNCGYKLSVGVRYCPKCATPTEDNDVADINIIDNQTPAQIPDASNGIAIAGFVCAILGINLVGLILSIIGLNGAKKANGKNKGLAIAGIIISIISMVFTFLISFSLIIFPIIRNNITEQWEGNTTSSYNSSYYDY